MYAVGRHVRVLAVHVFAKGGTLPYSVFSTPKYHVYCKFFLVCCRTTPMCSPMDGKMLQGI